MELAELAWLGENGDVVLFYILGYIALATVAWPLSITLHLCAQACAAWVLAIDVYYLQIGHGEIWRRWRWGRREWVIRRNPYGAGGLGTAYPDGPSGRRLFACMVATGPLCTIGVLVVCVALLVSAQQEQGPFALLMALVIFSVTSVLTLRGSLTLRGHLSQWHVTASDMRAFRELWSDPLAYENLVIHQIAWRAAADAGRAIESETDGLNVVGTFGPKERLESFFVRRITTTPGPKPLSPLHWMDYYCTWAVFTGDRTLLGRVEPYSKTLFDERPEERTLWGTRGAVLLLTGKAAEGMALLEKVMATDGSPVDRAISGCCLAWAAHQKGDVTARDRWWAESLRANGGKPAIDWIARELFPDSPAQSTKISV